MLTFNILIDTADQINSMKADLAKYFPDIKSSHRTEALARALGFATNAALRATVSQSHADFWKPAIMVPVNWNAFNDYLKEKGFQATAKPLYLAAGRACIKLTMELEPNLTRSGNGINIQHHKNETAQQRSERFWNERNDMLSDLSVEEFLRSYTVVSRITPTRTITTKRGAYNLKHIAEKASFVYPDGEKSEAKYVCTGSLIFAALAAGFYYKGIPHEQGVYFNMLQRSIDDLDCEIRPNGATAQARAARKLSPKRWSAQLN